MAGWYTEGRYLCMTGLNLVTADLRALLVKDGYTFDPDHDMVDDVSSAEVVGGSYARQALENESVARDLTNDRAYLDADDITFDAVPTGQNQINAVIVYVHNAADSAAALISYLNFTPKDGNGSDISIQWDPAGIIEIA